MVFSFYQRALVVLGVFVFFSNLPTYLDELNRLMPPMYWMGGFCVLAIPLLRKQKMFLDLISSPLGLWCLAYIWISLIWFLWSSQSEIATREIRWRLLTVMQLLAMMAVFEHPRAVHLARKTLIVVVLWDVAVNVYELFDPLPVNRVQGRSAGFYLDANVSGAALVTGMILSIEVLPSWSRIPYILLTGLGVLVTFSRGGMVAWVLAVAALVLARRVDMTSVFKSAAIGIILAIAIAVPDLDLVMSGVGGSAKINKDVKERMEWFSNPLGVQDRSSWERQYIAKKAWEKIAERPVLGWGTGAYQEAVLAPHNIYLSFMEDHGVLGAFIMPLLIIAVSCRVRGNLRALALVYGGIVMFLSFFSHTMLGDSYSLLGFSLMAAVGATQARPNEAPFPGMVVPEPG